MWWYAFINEKNVTLKVRHAEGYPQEIGKTLPIPQVLVINKLEESFFLNRYTSDGQYSGDTWHKSLNEAQQQAKYEYDLDLDEWENMETEYDQNAIISKKVLI